MPEYSIFENGVPKGEREAEFYTAFKANGTDLDSEWSRYSREVAAPDWRKKVWIQRGTFLAIWLGGLIGGALLGGGILHYGSVGWTLLMYLVGFPSVAAVLASYGAFTDKRTYYAQERAEWEREGPLCFAVGGFMGAAVLMTAFYDLLILLGYRLVA